MSKCMEFDREYEFLRSRRSAKQAQKAKDTHHYRLIRPSAACFEPTTGEKREKKEIMMLSSQISYNFERETRIEIDRLYCVVLENSHWGLIWRKSMVRRVCVIGEAFWYRSERKRCTLSTSGVYYSRWNEFVSHFGGISSTRLKAIIFVTEFISPWWCRRICAMAKRGITA